MNTDGHGHKTILTKLMASKILVNNIGVAMHFNNLCLSVFICGCLCELQKTAVMPIGWVVSAFPLSAF
jgi:hypothetical protein